MGRARGATAFHQRVHGLSPVDDIARAHSLTCLGERAQSVGVGLDLGGFAQGQIGFDGEHHRLLHAAVVFLCGGA